MKTNRTDVLVTGAGPVGLTAALFLHEQGLRTMVVEAKPRGVTHSYALALHPESLDLLEAAGAVGPVLEQALPVHTVSVYAGMRRLASVPVASPTARHPFLAVIGQDVLESALGQALARAGTNVFWNHRLARFAIGGDTVLADVDELEERILGYAAARLDWMVKRTRSVEARFLVGADGHDSLVRRQAGIDFPEVRRAEHFAVFEFQCAEPLPAELAIVLHDDGLGVLWPLPGGRARWSFAIDPAKSEDAWRQKDHEPVQIVGPGVYPALDEASFHRLRAERAPWFTASPGHVYWRMLVRFERRLAASFGQGRVWLAGDAAHLTGPGGIQSMNVGLREARELARAIVRAEGNGEIARPLHAYGDSRTAEWRRLHGLVGRVEGNIGAAPEIVRAKDDLLACLPASGDALVQMAANLGLRLIE